MEIPSAHTRVVIAPASRINDRHRHSVANLVERKTGLKPLRSLQIYITKERSDKPEQFLKSTSDGDFVKRYLGTGSGFHAFYADLERADLQKVDLWQTNLSNANLTEANLQGTDLRFADLRFANLSNANLTRANLQGTDLRFADLSNTNLTRVNLQGAGLRFADLSNTNLTGANLQGAYLHNAKLPLDPNWPQTIKSKSLKGTDLSYAELRYANLTRVNLQGADLRFAELRYANLTRVNLQGADLSYADLSNANLTRVNLQGADLRFADLSNANLTEANLKGTKSADLRMVRGGVKVFNLGEGSVTAGSFLQSLYNTESWDRFSMEPSPHSKIQSLFHELITHKDTASSPASLNNADRLLRGLLKPEHNDLLNRLLTASAKNDRTISSHAEALFYLADQNSISLLYQHLLESLDAQPNIILSFNQIGGLLKRFSASAEHQDLLGVKFQNARQISNSLLGPVKQKLIDLILFEKNNLKRRKLAEGISIAFQNPDWKKVLSEYAGDQATRPAELERLIFSIRELKTLQALPYLGLSFHRAHYPGIGYYMPLDYLSITKLGDYLAALGPSEKNNLTKSPEFAGASEEKKRRLAEAAIRQEGREAQVKPGFPDTPTKERAVLLEYITDRLLPNARKNYFQTQIHDLFSGSDFSAQIGRFDEEGLYAITLAMGYHSVSAPQNQQIIKTLLKKELSSKDTRDWIMEAAKSWIDRVKSVQPTFKPDHLRRSFTYTPETGQTLRFEVETEALHMFRLGDGLYTKSCLSLGEDRADFVATIITNANVSLIWVKNKSGNPLARFLTSIDDQGRLWVHPVYKHISGNLNLPLTEFRQAYSNFLGLDLGRALQSNQSWKQPLSFMDADTGAMLMDHPLL